MPIVSTLKNGLYDVIIEPGVYSRNYVENKLFFEIISNLVVRYTQVIREDKLLWGKKE